MIALFRRGLMLAPEAAMAEKKLTGKIARERIRLMETPRPAEGIIEGYRALGDALWDRRSPCATSCSASMSMKPRANT